MIEQPTSRPWEPAPGGNGPRPPCLLLLVPAPGAEPRTVPWPAPRPAARGPRLPRRFVTAAVAGAVAVAGLGVATGCSGEAGGRGRLVSSSERPGTAAVGRGTDARQRALVGEDVGAGAVVRGAADVLRRWGSSRTRTSMRMATGGTLVTIVGRGRFDYVGRRGRLWVTLPETARIEQGPITELVVPGALYMRNRGAGLPPEKWVRVETDRLADGDLVTGGATDPVAAAELLRGARDVAFVGTAVVGGVRTRHYRGTADLWLASRRAPGTSARALRAAARSFTASRVPFDAYLDGEGRLRRVRQEFQFRSVSGVEGVSDDVTVVSVTELYDFGVPVAFAVPRGSDIYRGKIVSPAASRAGGG
jgi:hypothetical protein